VQIGPYKLPNNLILAPMAGVTDRPFRQLCRAQGAGLAVSEMVSSNALLWGSKKTQRRIDHAGEDAPVSVQIAGADPAMMADAARFNVDHGAQIIDINMGCSARKVAYRGSGAGLLKDPPKIGRIFARLTRALSIPVTGKIRLGWDDDSLNYLEVAKILEDNGASLIAVHGRTKEQAYKGQANWDAIAEIKQAVGVPVIGNGDVRTAADIERIKQYTGCDGVMIGRAAIGNPWIFQRKDFDQVTLAEKSELIYRHLDLMLDFYGEERGLILFRKHVVKYVRGLSHIGKVKQQLITCTRPEEFVALMNAYEAEAAERAVVSPSTVGSLSPQWRDQPV